MSSHTSGNTVRDAGLALAAALLASACSRAPEPARVPAGPPLRLLEHFHEAEVRADSLDLPFLIAGRRLRRPMWQEPIETGGGLLVWTQEKDVELALPIATRADKQLRIRARCQSSLGPRLPMTVFLNDRSLGGVVLTRTDQDFRFAVPGDFQVLSENVLRLSVPRRFKPPRRADGPPAAVAVSRLELSPAGHDGPIVVPTLKDDRLLLPPGAIVGFFLKNRAGAELTLRASGDKIGGRLLVALETKAGRTPLGGVAPTRGTELRARLEAPDGALVRLDLVNASEVGMTLEGVAVRGLEAPRPSRLPAARLSGRPSVVLFLVDTLRADRLGAYGFDKPTSPAFDAFAREAVLFEDAWAQAPWTRPTVASIFTGLHVSTHGAVGFDRALPASFDTMAEILKRGGYRTGASVANHVVSIRFGFAQGFDSWNGGEARGYNLSAAATVERGLKWLDSAAGPFFLYLHTLEPHAPYEPSAEGWAPFRRAAEERHPSLPILMKATISPDESDYLESLYEGEILDNDRAFRALLDGLGSRGLLDSTIVLFTADHGEEFLDHGGKGHGHTLYRELTRIPLAVRLPGALRGGVREAQPVAQVDLLPTLASLLGLVPPRTEGRDLSSLWLGRAVPRDPPELVAETKFGKAEKSALRIGSLKVTVNSDPRRYGRAGGPLELYDLSLDPHEQRNLAQEDTIAARWLANRLGQILETGHRTRAARGEEKVELTDEDREALKALGYVQ